MKKSSLESQLVISEVMMPNQANIADNIHGGEINKEGKPNLVLNLF